MPTSQNGADPLEASLKTSLGIKASLDDQIASSSLKKVLFQKVEFEEAKTKAVHQLDKLKSKYVYLKSAPREGVFQKPYAVDGAMQKTLGTTAATTSLVNGGAATRYPADDERSWNRDENFPRAKLTLYKGEVTLTWPKVCKIGAGLHNMGNTCFLNSVLQCLTYTAPLSNYLMSSVHTQMCRMGNFCMMCELQRHVRRCLENSNQAIRPQPIISRLRSIAKHMQWGRQEDAHEFLRYVVEAMLRSCLDGHAKLDPTSKATTVVNKIFSGYLRSQVQCSNCKAKSDTYDPFLDISLDIKNVNTVDRAFQKFVEAERLDGDNSYDCPRCKRSCPATKRFTIHKPSNVLTVQLKRFDYNRMFGGKISRHIDFKSQLDLRPYMSIKGDPVPYQLYAVLVHSGFGCNSGHYYCYVRAPNNAWYCMNDAHVSMCSFERVMQQEAYLLFYIRTTTPNAAAKKPVPMVTPLTKAHVGMNGTISPGKPIGKPTNEVGAAVGRSSWPGNPTPLASQREKLSFGIRPKLDAAGQPGQTENAVRTQKSRIVLNIKRNVDGSYLPMKLKPSLVPYKGEDSDSDKGDPTKESKPTETQVAKTPVKTDQCDGAKQEDAKPVMSAPSLVEAKIKPKKFSLTTPNKLDAQLVLNTSVPRVNATSPWSIMHKDSAISPSIGSESSNTSVNSTTEWKIHDRNTPSTPLVPECQHPGWSVVDKKADKPDKAVKPLILKKCKDEKLVSPVVNDEKSPLLPEEKEAKEERKKKKKKRKNTSDSSDDEPSSKYRRFSDDSSDSPKRRKKKKHKHERKRKSSESEYEWVERTKETITQPVEASVQRWDAHERGDAAGTKTGLWDGSKKSSVVEELESQSARGFGPSVLSWNGDQSSLDKELSTERKEKRRTWEDEYEEELDRGKSKKYKENRHHSSSSLHGGRNLFQAAQDERNRDKAKSKTDNATSRHKDGQDGHHKLGKSSSLHDSKWNHKSDYHRRHEEHRYHRKHRNQSPHRHHHRHHSNHTNHHHRH